MLFTQPPMGGAWGSLGVPGVGWLLAWLGWLAWLAGLAEAWGSRSEIWQGEPSAGSWGNLPEKESVTAL